ncbi:MAG: VWA domain-containing protein [Clostridia bacterium]|nr:VWA domain-containing protein [Clostridia bacterium]
MNNNYQGNYQGNQGNYQGGQGNYQGGQAMDYTVDMVFCIDATGSMEDMSGKQNKIINMVKQNALNFYNDFSDIMNHKGKSVRQLRVRIVAFRDYIADQENAMLVTDFFLLPQQAAEFEACINSIHAQGGGDLPEDGLEALAYAIKSQWTTEGTKKRQVIVVWTDAGTHEIGFGSRSPYYPGGMPANMSELNDWWDDMHRNAKRLVMFAPDEEGWSYISRTWDNTVHIPSAAGNGLAEQNYAEILSAIANSV